MWTQCGCAWWWPSAGAHRFSPPELCFCSALLGGDQESCSAAGRVDRAVQGKWPLWKAERVGGAVQFRMFLFGVSLGGDGVSWPSHIMLEVVLVFYHILKSKRNVLIIFFQSSFGEESKRSFRVVCSRCAALLIHCSSAVALHVRCCTLVYIALNTEFRSPSWTHTYSVPRNSDLILEEYSQLFTCVVSQWSQKQSSAFSPPLEGIAGGEKHLVRG